jgi:uncharacterized protein (TIGR03084 family)
MQLTGPMDEVLTGLAEQNDELDGLVSGLDHNGWAAPSRCPGWSIADVVLHLAQTDEMGAASADGTFTARTAAFGRPASEAPAGATADDLAGRAVAAERAPGAVVYARWRAAAAAQAKALAACEPSQRLPWVAGEISALTLATTRLAEHWIHTGDVAAALGREPAATDRLRPIARLAWRTLPYAFSRAGRTLSGPVALALTGPDGAVWEFTPDGPGSSTVPATIVTGPALDFCLLAARRIPPSETALEASGPDRDAVLELVRTFA